ncbi:MAG TPA: hydrogenase iron-sulfur subunit [bacterium]|nr:hydrogenase iron-sulfur subunit [bacterium]
MNPKAVIFYCNWSTYPGLHLSRMAEEPVLSDHKMLVSMCSGRVSPELVLEAFQNGAWGVLISACPVDKCEHDGNYKTWARVVLLKSMLPQLGLEAQRLKLEWVDKGESDKLNGAIKSFMDEIKNLGPVSIPVAAG